MNAYNVAFVDPLAAILKDFFLAKSRGRLFQAEGPFTNATDYEHGWDIWS